MNMKKAMASIASVAMAASMLSAFSVSTSAVTAGSTTIDFEDGDFSFVYMNVDDGGADNSKLSVEEYDGSMQLKVDVEDKTKTPKVWFDLDKITDRANTIQIKTIEMDLTFVPEDPTQSMGWIGGTVGSAGGFDMNADGKGQVNPSWAATDWSCEDNNAYVEGQPAKVHAVKKFLLPSTQYTEEGTNPFFGIMEWGGGNRTTDWVMYVDNIVLKDGNGNALPLGVTAPAETEAAAEETTAAETEAAAEETTAAETEAAAEETTAAETEAAAEETTAAETVAETTAAPAETEAVAATTAAPDSASGVAPTGNVAVASIAAVMALAGAAAFASKRK